MLITYSYIELFCIFLVVVGRNMYVLYNTIALSVTRQFPWLRYSVTYEWRHSRVKVRGIYTKHIYLQALSEEIFLSSVTELFFSVLW